MGCRGIRQAHPPFPQAVGWLFVQDRLITPIINPECLRVCFYLPGTHSPTINTSHSRTKSPPNFLFLPPRLRSQCEIMGFKWDFKIYYYYFFFQFWSQALFLWCSQSKWGDPGMKDPGEDPSPPAACCEQPSELKG